MMSMDQDALKDAEKNFFYEFEQYLHGWHQCVEML